MKIAEVVKQEIPILEYAQFRGLTPRQVGPHEYTLKEHDSIRIDEIDNLCYRHASGEGGSIIDFVMILEHIDGRLCDKHKALSILRGYLLGHRPQLLHRIDSYKAQAHSPPEKKELRLPEAIKGRYNRIFAYLSKTRGIDTEIISEFIHENRLYEDVHHNCIFVGYDHENNAAYAVKRGTLTNKAYKGEVYGSNKEVGLYINNGSTSLFVTESVIDAMSIMTLLKMNGRNYKAYNYLSLGCMSDKPMHYHLPGSGLHTLFFALDNDYNAVYKKTGLPAPNWGQMRAAKYKEKYEGMGYRVIVKRPVLKDFNEDLLHVRSVGSTRMKA